MTLFSSRRVTIEQPNVWKSCKLAMLKACDGLLCSTDEDEEHLLVDWFTLIHEKHLLVRREAELVYT